MSDDGGKTVLSGSPHLKVELRRLRRGLDGRFGFDLTRFCAGCWGRLGRVLRRGRRCPSCHKRVCKDCRHFVDQRAWICVLCYRKKFIREEWWHDDANVQRFKGSQGKTGTYLLRLTDWSSHGALDPRPVTDGPRVRSVSDAPVRTTPLERIDLSAPRSRSETYHFQTYQSPTNQLDAQLSSRLGRKWKLKWKLLAHEAKTSPDLPQQGGNLQYTSSTLKRKRREIRESTLMLSSKPKPPMPTKTDQIESTPSPRRDPEWSLPFLPETDEFKVRHSVRGTTRKKRGRLGRSSSLPSELHQEWPSRLDQEFWRAGFVQSRVRRLEEDLATVRPDSWSFFWSEGESQSLCSLELGRIVPDGDDYRIAYLSSAGTSLESSLEYVGGLDVVREGMEQTACSTLDRRDLPPIRNEDWDMSLSSTDNRVSPSDDEDEFEYFLPEDGFDFSMNLYKCKNGSGISGDIEASGRKDCEFPLSNKDVDASLNQLNEETPIASTEEFMTNDSGISDNVETSGRKSNEFQPYDKDVETSLNHFKEETPIRLLAESMTNDSGISEEVEACCRKDCEFQPSDKDVKTSLNHFKEETPLTSTTESGISMINDSRISDDAEASCRKDYEFSPSYEDSKTSLNKLKEETPIASTEEFMINDLGISDDVEASGRKGDEFSPSNKGAETSLNKLKEETPMASTEESMTNDTGISEKVETCGRKDDEFLTSYKDATTVLNQLKKETPIASIEESMTNCSLSPSGFPDNEVSGDLSKDSSNSKIPTLSSMAGNTDVASLEVELKTLTEAFANLGTAEVKEAEEVRKDTRSSETFSTVSSVKKQVSSNKLKLNDSNVTVATTEDSMIKSSFVPSGCITNEVAGEVRENTPITVSLKFDDAFDVGTINGMNPDRRENTSEDEHFVKIFPDDRAPIDCKKSNEGVISVTISCKGGKTFANEMDKNILQRQTSNGSLSVAEQNIQLESNVKEDTSKVKNASDTVSNRNNPEATEVNNFTEFSKDFYDEKLRNLHSKAKIPEDLKVDAPRSNATGDEKSNTNSNSASNKSRDKSPTKSCNRSDSFNRKNLCCIKDGNWSKKYEETSTVSVGPLVELAAYEPLSTPFSAIYAISFGRYPSRDSYFVPKNEGADPPARNEETSVSENSSDITPLLDKHCSSGNLGHMKVKGVFSDLSLPTRPWSHSSVLKKSDEKFGLEVLTEGVAPIILTNSLITGLLKINRIDIDSILNRPNVVAPLLGVSLKYIPMLCDIRSSESEERNGNDYNDLVSEMNCCVKPKLKSLKYARSDSKLLYQSVPPIEGGQIDVYDVNPELQNIVDIDSFYLTDNSEHRYRQIISKGIRKLISGGIQGRIINFSPTPFVTTIIPSCRGEYRLQKTQMLEILINDEKTEISSSKKRIAICFLPRNQNCIETEAQTAENQVSSAAESRLAEATRRHGMTSQQPRRAAFAECFRQNAVDGRGEKECVKRTTTAVVVDLDYLSRCCGSIDRSFHHVELDGSTQALLISILRRSAMADEDPRSLGKVVRTQGKNISKLMKLFDNGEPPKQPLPKSSKSSSVCCVSDSAPVDNNVTSSPLDIVDSPLDTQNEVSNGECDANGEMSQIPYCRKVAKSGLWDNVDISGKSDDVWESQNGSEDPVSSYETSTAELNDLIASSRAELSKKAPSVSDRSNLEDYFTSFENSTTRKCDSFDLSEYSPVPNGSQFPFNNDVFDPPAMYDCDVNEMSFDEEDTVISDTSSEEDLKCHPAMINTNYLPAYALHTIIEESCEESERDSRTATPTNNTAASKLERYFSWDIINDADLRKKQDDDSTIYSDSLSEHSGSLVGEDPKDIDPTHLASSRLEKYFTSGLVDDQNYFYPDDAEFVDDAPVSDFEEDSIHLKISRSALLSSLETKPSSLCEEEGALNCKESGSSVILTGGDVPDVELSLNTNAKSDVCDQESLPDEITSHEEDQSLVNNEERIPNPQVCDSESIKNTPSDAKFDTDSSQTVPPVEFEDSPIPSATDLKISPKHSPVTVRLTSKDDHSSLQRSVVKKDHLANDIQGIIKKLLSHFSEEGSESLRKNFENDYISAWQLLETEIERLLQSIPSHTLDNNSCNSSTIDSNNSDYGSDTIESMDCMTDDDDTADPKIRLNPKCPPPLEFLGSSYSTDLSSFNISDETLNIWKRLIHSLQKDNAVLSENKVCDPTAEARLYIKDQIVTLMHTVTVHDAIPEIEKEDIYSDQSKAVMESLTENYQSEEINEAFNVNLSSSNIRTHLPIEEIQTESKMESSSDEGISVGSTENVHSKDEGISDKPGASVDDPIKNLQTLEVEESLKVGIDSSPKHVEQDLISVNLSSSPKNKIVHELKQGKKESDLKFSVFVDIELDEDSGTVTKQKVHSELHSETSPASSSKSSEISEKNPDSLFVSSKDDVHEPGTSKSCRDTGYFSFKSSDDSLLNTSTPSAELVDVPNFKSLKRTVKKFQISNTLSKSTNNIMQNLSVPDTQFSTLQLKPKKVKEASSSSRQFSSLFSPSAMLKRFTGGKSNEASGPESSIPPKYLKKYARSTSVDNESLFGAASMPHLNNLRPGDSYSELGLYNDRTQDSCLTLDEDTDTKRYFTGSQSVLSLGAHSASMTSVYSASGCHYGYVTVTGDVLFGLNYNQKSQMMEVFVKQCRNIAATDTKNNKSNPYVKVYLLPDKTRSGKRKTKTKKNTLSPVFNELLRFPVGKNELESRTLWLSVWNSDLFGRNDFLGEISLPLGYRLLDSPTLRWYPLQERVESLTSPLNYKGELFLALKYVPRDLSLEARFRSAPVISQRGALHVLVKEARNISANRSSGTLDAFCKSYLLPDKSKSSKQKTPVVKKSGHPKWYYTVIYEDLSMDELKERSLELTVWDHDKLTSNEFMGGIRLNIGTGLYHGVPVEWMDSRRDESSLWQAMLESPNMWVDGCLPLRPTMQFHNS